jgi:uncharacterized membrane protein YdbT with pleckstrin-like domain
MINDTSNGAKRLSVYLGIAVSGLVILGFLAGTIYAWSDVQYRCTDNTRRIDRIERVMSDQDAKLDRILNAVEKGE